MPIASALTIDNTASADTLMQTIFGNGVTIVTGTAAISGVGTQSGTFSGGDATLGDLSVADTGVILSTGDVAAFTNAGDGISTDTNISAGTSTNHTGAGDTDLDIVSGQTTFDAVVLEADFTTTGNFITMQFTFSSEEYLEYVNSGVNDAFGVWINGTYAPFTPATNDLVSIDTINNTSSSNLYMDNPETADTYNSEMDGSTVVLSIKAPVNPAGTNTIKIALGDGGDGALDSNVLIAANSVQTIALAFEDTVAMEPNTAVTVDVLDNDIDTNGAGLTITEINGNPIASGGNVVLPTGETITLNADGTLTIENDGDIGSEAFTYRVVDGAGSSDIGFVTINTEADVASDFIVEGTFGDDTIDATYVGDPQGDRIDNLDHSDGSDADSIRAGAGNDEIAAGNGDDTIDAGTGSDTVLAGSGDDFIEGGDGNDLLRPGPGSDTVLGGAGNDTLELSDSDVLDGGTDIDLLDATFGAFGETVVFNADNSGSTDNGSTFQNIEVFNSDGGNDSYNASAAADDLVILTGADDDTIFGGSGTDVIDGGADDDLLDGGLSNDTVLGGTGNDTILLNDGYLGDSIVGGEDLDGLDIDILDASGVTNDGVNVFLSGNETGAVTSTEGTANFEQIESFVLTDQADDFDGDNSSANVTIDGGLGDDTLSTGSGDDSIIAGDGNDNIGAGAGNNTVLGGAGDDTIESNGFNNVIDGGDDADRIAIGISSGDTISGGEGGNDADTLTGTSANDTLTITLTGNEAGTFLDDDGDDGEFTGIEAFELTAGADTFNGAAATTEGTSVWGFGGDDVITGTGGGDSLDGDSGSDSIDGGAGADTIIGDDGNDTLLGGAGADEIYVSSGNNSIDGGSGNDAIFAGSDADIIDGGIGNDTIYGGAGDDSIELENDFGNDTIFGGETGETTGDTLDLSAITDDLTIDLSNANAETGTVSDGTGTASFQEIENITLGSGRDTLTLADGGGDDTVTGFDLSDSGDTTAVDQLDVSALTSDGGTTPVDVNDVTVTADGSGNAILSFPGGESITLMGVATSDLNTPEALVAIGIPPALPNFIVEGGSGADTIDASYVGDPEGDQIDNLDHSDSSNADSVQAGAGADVIDAGLGDDTIDAGDGNDTIFDSAGNDSVVGGEGLETFDYTTLTGDDTIVGGELNDTAVTNSGDKIDAHNSVEGLNVVFDGDESGDVTGASGSIEFTEIEHFLGGQGSDTIDASLSSVQQILDGGEGADTIQGGIGDDIIAMGQTQDFSATDGDDDTLVLVDGFGNDSIEGFETPTDLGGGSFSGNDQVDVTGLTDLTGEPVNVDDVTVSDTNGDGTGDAILSFPNGESITLFGVDPADVTSDEQLVAMGIPAVPVQYTNVSQLISFGNFAELDTDEGSSGYEGSTAPIIGTTLSGAAANANIVTFDYLDLDGDARFEANHMNPGENLTVDGVSSPIDEIVIVTLELTFIDGSTGTTTAIGYQLENGEFFVGDYQNNIEGDTVTSLEITNISDTPDSGDLSDFSGGGTYDLDSFTFVDPLNYIVEGTGGDDTIDAGYTGDPQGDMVDAGDSLESDNDDSITAGAGNDSVEGDAGEDSIFGEGGLDTIYGGSGNDSIDGGDGADEIYGGDGTPGPDAAELIADGSFESATPTAFGQVNLLSDWNSWNTGTSDLNEEGGYAAPSAPTDGDNFVSLVYGSTGYKEGISQDLAAPLQAGTEYTLTVNAAAGVYSGTTTSDPLGGSVEIEVWGNPTAGVTGVDGSSTPAGSVLLGTASVTTTINSGGTEIVSITFTPTTNIETISLSLLEDDTLSSGQFGVLNFDEVSLQETALTNDDTIFGGIGEDTIYGEEGDDELYGNEDDDSIIAGSGNDTVEGGTGNDTILLGDGDDWVNGDIGDDSIVGGAGNDFLRGSFGDDTIIGGTGDDTLWGGFGDDSIVVDANFGDYTIEGEEDAETLGDTMDVSNVVSDLTWDLTNPNPEAGSFTDGTNTGTYVDIENIILGAGTDTLTLGTFGGSNTVSGFSAPTDTGGGTYSGNDQLDVSGLLDFDSNATHTGNVTVTEVGGNAVLTFPNGETLTLVGVPAADVSSPAQLIAMGIPEGPDGYVDGTAGNDTIDVNYTGDPNFDRVDNNDAQLPGATGDDDFIRAGAGDDSVIANAGNDSVEGGIGNDTLEGGAGADTLDGEAGADNLVGGFGDDSLVGGAGNDTLNGQVGDDELLGGDGSDVFALEDDFGSDTIVGGEIDDAAGDTLDMSGVGGALTYDLTGVDAEAGTVTDGTGTVTFSEIENIQLSSGTDILTLDNGSGDDIVSGFAAPFLAGDGSWVGLDQLDVSNMIDGNGAPVNTGDVDISDTNGDGTGDTILTFPGGETLTLVGVLPSAFPVPEALAAIGIPLADFIVEGTGVGELIDAAYLGDPEGDIIDAGDAENGSDDDIVEAGAGDDTVLSGAGNDSIFGDEGADSVDAGAGDDTVFGGDDADTISGGADNDSLFGQAGADSLMGDGGDDVIEGGLGVDTLEGGIGNDTLNGGDDNDSIDGGAGDDSLLGSFGDDTLKGGIGADTMEGGFGDDTFIITNDFGNDDIFGGSDLETNGDTLDLSDVTTGLTVDLSSANPEDGTFADGTSTASFADIETIILSSGEDTITLADGSGLDVVEGFVPPADNGDGTFTGADQLDVSGMTDLDGNPVNTFDVTVSDTNGDGTGDAILTFPNGEAITLLGVDPATVTSDLQLAALGIPISDGVVTGSGVGELIDENYTGDPDGDFVDNGDAHLAGYTGDDDSISAGGGDDTIIAGLGDDNVNAGLGNDSIEGGIGADTIRGEEGDDTILGGDGDDSLLGFEGSDSVDGGSGDDFINTRTSLGTGAPDQGYPGAFTGDSDATNDQDTVDGGIGNDTILTGDDDDSVAGGDGADSIDAGFDDDTVDGGIGSDTITGGEGNDSLDGGDGGDLIYGDDVSGDAAPLNIADETDLLTANSLDTISGGEGNDTIFGMDDGDSITGDAGDDVLDGGLDDDTVDGGIGNDSILGDHGNDNLIGGSGVDTLEGGIGNDTLSGGVDGDSLVGGDGDDTINVAQGDTVTGGDGDDFFNLVDLGELDTDTITITGGEGGETNGDTLALNGLHGGNTINIIDPDDVNGGLSGNVTLLDGTVVNFFNIESIICFVPGTEIATPYGGRMIEDLKIGDSVVTQDNGVQKVRWIGKTTVPATDKFAPIRFDKSVFAGASDDLLVSPQHRMLFKGYEAELLFGENEVLVPAIHLLDGHSVTRESVEMVTYIHIMFEQHEIIFAQGIATESFHPGSFGVDCLAPRAREELFALFPEMRRDLTSYGQSARTSLRANEARALMNF
ncbi:Hint domain-containing protein [Planktotalea sp.]|uniref:Hint domain-containing protein n=1 Tax=Planktotalea sp. TaxID=2029877 RepID=UPI003F6A9371